MYEKSLELESENIRTLCNFGLFCYKALKKMDDAEALFKRGLVVADLIAYDLEEAEEDGEREEHFKKNRVKVNAAAGLLSNYGNFLKSVRGFASESENMHIKAIGEWKFVGRASTSFTNSVASPSAPVRLEPSARRGPR